jgi:hypothetical protein
MIPFLNKNGMMVGNVTVPPPRPLMLAYRGGY